MITDHGSFVLFNVYGPAVTNEEAERFAMKLTLYEVYLTLAQTRARQGMDMQCQALYTCLCHGVATGTVNAGNLALQHMALPQMCTCHAHLPVRDMSLVVM